MYLLKNHILISMPHMEDPFFTKSVVLLCDHSQYGAMGIVINKVLNNYENQKISNFHKNFDHIYFGGPLMIENEILLHEKKINHDKSYKISNNLFLSTRVSLKNDNDIKFGKKKLILGHSGWSPGQLESEIENGDWMIQKPNHELLFNTKNDQIWDRSIKSFGIEIENLSTLSGQA